MSTKTPFNIEALAGPSEVFLTQFTVRPDEPNMATKELAEADLTRRYGKQYTLRFHYGDLGMGGYKVTSKEFGQQTVTPDVRDFAFGGAVFGTPKS